MALKSRSANLIEDITDAPSGAGATLTDLSVARDKAQTQQQELASLKQQASRLNHLLQVMPAGVVVIDGQGVVRQANEQAKVFLGEPLEGELWRTIIARSFKPRADDGDEVFL